MANFKSPIQKAAAPAKDSPVNNVKGGKTMAPPAFSLAGGETIQKKDLLDKTKLASAKSFYGRKKSDFTPEVIKEIQGKVGTALDGKMNDATLQAIAKFQQGNTMSVDGKLGTQSLPKLFPHGLATESSQEAFARDYLGIDWAKLATPQAKGQKIIEYINKQLKAAGVPEVGFNIKALGAASGQFFFTTWDIDLGKKFLDKKAHTQADLDGFANTVIHEARHAEQWYNMAQRLAGEGKTAAQIKKQLFIPDKIAKAASADSIKKNTAKALVVKGMHDSVYGSGSAHRTKVLGPKGTYKDYRALPEESDAWRVGDEFDEELKDERTKKVAEEKAEKAKKEKGGG